MSYVSKFGSFPDKWTLRKGTLSAWPDCSCITSLHSFELFGKHSSNDGSGIKSGEVGSVVCFLCCFLSELVVGGSKVKVALGAEHIGGGHISFLQAFEMRPTTSKPVKKVVLENLVGAEWLPFLHTTDVKLA